MFINIIIIKVYHYYMIWLCSGSPMQSFGCGWCLALLQVGLAVESCAEGHVVQGAGHSVGSLIGRHALAQRQIAALLQQRILHVHFQLLVRYFLAGGSGRH